MKAFQYFPNFQNLQQGIKFSDVQTVFSILGMLKLESPKM